MARRLTKCPSQLLRTELFLSWEAPFDFSYGLRLPRRCNPDKTAGSFQYFLTNSSTFPGHLLRTTARLDGITKGPVRKKKLGHALAPFNEVFVTCGCCRRLGSFCGCHSVIESPRLCVSCRECSE